MKPKRFAVVLAGCGVYDGSEIHEAVLTLLAIDKVGSTCQCFAPDMEQFHVINHLTGETEKQSRNVLTESARIARGNVKKITHFDPVDFDALIIPGGFGVAKNLCTFALDGPNGRVNPDVESAIQRAYKAGLPIGALCIAPALLAQVLGNITVTIGSDPGTARHIETLGANHIVTKNADIVVDKENKIVTSPCYMLDSPIRIVAKGAKKTIKALIKLMD